MLFTGEPGSQARSVLARGEELRAPEVEVALAGPFGGCPQALSRTEGSWPDRATASAEVFTFIETFYNRRRLRKHKTFGYLTPAETRQRHQHALAA
ncbi:hypothetical protein [Streptomyces scopuliridis]|uniref:hypothetical protein n=1 Tax=Streptomyces scopuliridis TaxID=452529 RepID=UPI003681DD47